MPHGTIYQDVTETVGNTPLIRLNRLGVGLPGRIAIKHEGYNPYDSVKDRIGAAMINDAVEKGRLKPGMIIVEPTSGNTGIGLAYVAAARGYRCIFTMPDTMTLERRHLLRALGCKVVLTEGPKGMKGAMARAEEILARLGDRAWMPRQFDNPANPAIHYRTTGPEIWADTGGKIDIFVAGVGTGRHHHRGGPVPAGAEARHPHRRGRAGREPGALRRPAVAAQAAGNRRRLHPRHPRHQDLRRGRPGEQRRRHRHRPAAWRARRRSSPGSRAGRSPGRRSRWRRGRRTRASSSCRSSAISASGICRTRSTPSCPIRISRTSKTRCRSRRWR